MNRILPLLLFGVFFSSHAAAVTTDIGEVQNDVRTSLLILFSDDAPLRAELDAIAAHEWPPESDDARRRAVTRVHLTSFARRAEVFEAQIRAALPATVREQVEFEPVPVFNAALVHLPQTAAAATRSALKAAQASGVSDVAHVSTQVWTRSARACIDCDQHRNVGPCCYTG